ncbi:MAG: hypothetical protein LUQ25_06520 [Methanoregulaceae archaeon]|nr:hypothetical protein [Methanoregulaceae archaeon]
MATLCCTIFMVTAVSALETAGPAASAISPDYIHKQLFWSPGNNAMLNEDFATLVVASRHTFFGYQLTLRPNQWAYVEMPVVIPTKIDGNKTWVRYLFIDYKANPAGGPGNITHVSVYNRDTEVYSQDVDWAPPAITRYPVDLKKWIHFPSAINIQLTFKNPTQKTGYNHLYGAGALVEFN